MNQVVPNCAPNHLRLTALNKYCCVHQHLHSSPHHHRRSRRRYEHVTFADLPSYRAQTIVQGQQRTQNSQPTHYSSTKQQHQRLMNKFKLNMAKSRLKLKELTRSHGNNSNRSSSNKVGTAPMPLYIGRTQSQKLNIQSSSKVIQYFKDSVPIISNMPLINIQNSSVLLINDSPFGLGDSRFGILHHLQNSETYFG